MKMPVVRLTFGSGLDVFVKPLRRFRKGSNAMGLAAPDANHGNDQENRTGRLNKSPPKSLPLTVETTPKIVEMTRNAMCSASACDA